MPPESPDETSSLERARKRLYEPATPTLERPALRALGEGSVPRGWEPPAREMKRRHPLRLAGVFFTAAAIFFVVSLSVAFYIFYIGGNSISVDKVAITVQGPTSISGGDTVPLAVTITNTNAVAIQNATLNIDFPQGTRSASDVTQDYPRYTENLGTLASGATVTRSVSAILFGGAGQGVSLPVSLSYSASGSNGVFVKKASYTIGISTTPLSISVDTVTEAVSGQPLTLSLTVRSNASVPLENVVVAGVIPFGFTPQSSSIPFTNSTFSLGTLAPGAVKTLSLTGTLTGEQSDQKAFHFTVGTAKSPQDQTVAVGYMTQDATVSIVAPFISTSLAINGNTSSNITLSPGRSQSLALTYKNTLATNVSNATIKVAISGAGVDYNSIQSSNGFYQSSDHSVVFSHDTDPSLALLVPGASGVGTITFLTLPASASVLSPNVTFTTSVSGTRVGQANVPEDVSAVQTKVAKIATTIDLAVSSLHSSGPFPASGPVPPQVGVATTYTVGLMVRTSGSPIAGSTITTVLPSYVTYTGLTAGSGTISYDPASHTVTWTMGDLAAATSVQGAFQVSLTPSTSQRGGSPTITGNINFSGYDRFAGVSVAGQAARLTTETPNDPGYVGTNAIVQ